MSLCLSKHRDNFTFYLKCNRSIKKQLPIINFICFSNKPCKCVRNQQAYDTGSQPEITTQIRVSDVISRVANLISSELFYFDAVMCPKIWENLSVACSGSQGITDTLQLCVFQFHLVIPNW
jgi:hypothetical protein